MRSLALFMPLVFVATLARAETVVVTPPPVPRLPDEPLPEWHPPARRAEALHLDVAPDARRAHTLRQAGLWAISLGGAQLFLGGILYVYAGQLARDVGSPKLSQMLQPDGTTIVVADNRFDPSIEDRFHRVSQASYAFLAIGGVLTAAGVAMFGVGQSQLHDFHRHHPRDPLPPLSGYEPGR